MLKKMKLITASIISLIVVMSFVMAYVDEQGFDWGEEMNDTEWEELLEDYPDDVYDITLQDEEILEEQLDIMYEESMEDIEIQAEEDLVDFPELVFEPDIPQDYDVRGYNYYG